MAYNERGYRGIYHEVTPSTNKCNWLTLMFEHPTYTKSARGHMLINLITQDITQTVSYDVNEKALSSSVKLGGIDVQLSV